MSALADPRQELFCQELAKGVSQVEAYRKAGYGNSTGHPSTLARDKRIIDRVAFLQAEEVEKEAKSLELATKKLGLEKERVLLELMRIAFSDVSNVIEWAHSGALIKDSSLLSKDVRAAISEVRVTPSGEIRIKMHDKIAALDKLAKHLGLLKQNLVLAGKLEVEVTDITNAGLILADRIASVAARLGVAPGAGKPDGRAEGSAPLGLADMGATVAAPARRQ